MHRTKTEAALADAERSHADDPQRAEDRQCLKQIPGGVVEEEDEFDAGDGSEEGGVGERSGTQRGGEGVEIRAEVQGLSEGS